MRRLMFTALMALTLHAAYPQDYSKWVKEGIWRNGFTEARPDKTVNTKEFYEQYHKNRTQWDALFAWLASTDLTNIPKGKYPIKGTTMVASVEDSSNQPLEKRKTESHRKRIDFQCVVKGTEGFALLDHDASTPNCEYDDKKDLIRYDYDKSHTNFFNVKAGHFVIFFPSDWHIAKVATKKKNQDIRVIVIKVDYIE